MSRFEKQKNPALSYRDSGVDIQAGNELIRRIRPIIKETTRPGVLGSLGGFGALFELPISQYAQPVLVSGTDGVGTKLKLACLMESHHTIGIDLVAMCVNDIITCGAEPLYFLDYFATGKLDIDTAQMVIQGIARGCTMAGCALTGGETAEMPDMYSNDEYDLAGFAVGIVEKEKILSPDKVQSGDILLGLQSSGPHSNGYSLIRKILELNDIDLDKPLSDSGETLGNALLQPTRIYVRPVVELLKRVDVSALCHVTGGGIVENLPRVLPDNVQARVSRASWTVPDIFKWLQDAGGIEQSEMDRTFNCGIGMILCVPPAQCDKAMTLLQEAGETVHILGDIVTTKGSGCVVLE